MISKLIGFNNKKVFQIGFNKCGTRSLQQLFSKSGVPSVHWRRNELAIAIARNKAAFLDPVKGYEEFGFYSDMECVNPKNKKICLIEAYKFYDYFFQWYPQAYYILNTRNVESWIKSRLNHGEGSYVEFYRYHYGFNSTDAVIEKWRLDWFEHHHNVVKFFYDKPGRLLIFDIEKDDPQKIVDFVSSDFELDPKNYTHQGDTKKIRQNKLKKKEKDSIYEIDEKQGGVLLEETVTNTNKK